MKNNFIQYSFTGWTNGKLSEHLNRDVLNLYALNLEDLIEKIKLFNKVACFECWRSLSFYKWEITLVDGMEIDRNIIDSDHFPTMIGANKIKVWGNTYEI